MALRKTIVRPPIGIRLFSTTQKDYVSENFGTRNWAMAKYDEVSLLDDLLCHLSVGCAQRGEYDDEEVDTAISVAVSNGIEWFDYGIDRVDASTVISAQEAVYTKTQANSLYLRFFCNGRLFENNYTSLLTNTDAYIYSVHPYQFATSHPDDVIQNVKKFKYQEPSKKLFVQISMTPGGISEPLSNVQLMDFITKMLRYVLVDGIMLYYNPVQWSFAQSFLDEWLSEKVINYIPQYTLCDLTLAVARELGIVRTGVVQSGTVKKIVDTTRQEDDDYWNGGTVWIQWDVPYMDMEEEYEGDIRSTEGQYETVSDYTKSTGEIILNGALTQTVRSGDRYVIATKHVPLSQLIASINKALRELGKLPYVDTSLVGDTSTQVYTLPYAGMDVKEVWIGNDDDEWELLHNWRLDADARGSGYAHKLILDTTISSDYTIMLKYEQEHQEMYFMNHVLHDSVPIERVVVPAVLDCLKWRYINTEFQSKYEKLLSLYEVKAKEVVIKHPIKRLARTNKLFTLNSNTNWVSKVEWD